MRSALRTLVLCPDTRSPCRPRTGTAYLPLGARAVGRGAGAGQAVLASPSPPSRKMATNFLVHEKIWFDKFKYDDAERKFYEQMNGPVAGSSRQVRAALGTTGCLPAPGGQALSAQRLFQVWWGLRRGGPGWLLGCWTCSCHSKGQRAPTVSWAWAGPVASAARLATDTLCFCLPSSLCAPHSRSPPRAPFFLEVKNF